MIQMSGQNSTFTAAYGWIYLIARVAYVPVYAFGLRPHRSIIWMVSFVAIVLMLLAALL